MSIDQARVIDTETQIVVVEVGIPGPVGDVTPEVQAAKEAAENAAQIAQQAITNIADTEQRIGEEITKCEEIMGNTVTNINNTVKEVENTAAVVAATSNAAPYDATKLYQKTEVIILENGSAYRCIAPSQGENPAVSSKWIPLAVAEIHTFTKDDYGYIVPLYNPQASEFWTVDETGFISPL